MLCLFWIFYAYSLLEGGIETHSIDENFKLPLTKKLSKSTENYEGICLHYNFTLMCNLSALFASKAKVLYNLP